MQQHHRLRCVAQLLQIAQHFLVGNARLLAKAPPLLVGCRAHAHLVDDFPFLPVEVLFFQRPAPLGKRVSVSHAESSMIRTQIISGKSRYGMNADRG